MSFTVQTPQRPLPGTYFQTPTISKSSIQAAQPDRRPGPPTASLLNVSQHSHAPLMPQVRPSQQSIQAREKEKAEPSSEIERASRTINETLIQETRYPELDNYVGQGISSDYDVSALSSWAPFQRVKVFDIPDKIFEQYNRAQVSTMMGLFAELNHAWVAIDNALYIWDYTQQNPDLIGFEEQSNTITAVRLVVPRSGVFIPSISRLVAVATTSELLLVGLSSQITSGGSREVTLYQTRMSVATKGMDINVVDGSSASGRIFFAGKGDGDLYELTYQQEEKWFQNRCGKINHTTKGFSALAPSLSFSQKPQQDYAVQIVIDDTRKLLYTLSSRSTIRTFHMNPNGALDLVIVKPLGQTLSNIGHMISSSELISPGMTIVSLSPIPSREASKLHLMATTSTGCRIFMSATSSYTWPASSATTTPSSMQVQHVKFPPADPAGAPSNPQQSITQVTNYSVNQGINTSSKALRPTRTAYRFSPGYFFCFAPRESPAAADTLFVSAPDSGRIARPQDSSQQYRYAELGLWLGLGSRAEDVGLASPPFSAALSPLGFGNELATQYDTTSTEIAILTNTGIHMMRRRRLVDMFAACITTGGGDEGLEGEIRKFVRQYGRAETAATALAAACGQAIDVTSDSRLAQITDPEILESARKAFIDYGGKPQLNENSMIDQSLASADSFRPSPRHEGLSLYLARLIRSIWKAPIVRELLTPTGGLTVLSTQSLERLREIQRAVLKLQEFLISNKNFIAGLAGPEALGQVSTRKDEVALQAEHLALHSLVMLMSSIIEGISFVLVLFDERIEEILLSLPINTRQNVRDMTYENLFCTSNGRDLAKELVKAIVNRNIANGSNVDTVAEALRRRCGSFCSADDVVIFKAQEQLKKATEAGMASDFGRNLLNESLRLFQQVAASLSTEQLHWAMQQYKSMHFYAGAIQLALSVAQEVDRGNRALSWIQDGRPEPDARVPLFQNRQRCYDLVHDVITALDQVSAQAPERVDGQYTLAARRKSEAYDVIDRSEDEVFQTNLYDWYLEQGQADRLLEAQSPYIVTYLRRKSSDDIAHADLLWKYYGQSDRFHDAATVQLALAKSTFALSLNRRIEYLSRAKANASAQSPGVRRQSRQALLHEVSDLLDIANIQDDLLQRLKADQRVTQDRKPEILKELDGQILSLTDLYNSYADQASYFDICILIYQAADHRDPTDIKSTWQNLLIQIHEETSLRSGLKPFEAVIDVVRSLGNRLSLSESTFPISDLVILLEKYAFEYQRGVGPPTWVPDVFLDLQVPYDSILQALEAIFYNDEAPFQGRNRRYIASDILYVVQRWFQDNGRRNGQIFGDDNTASGISKTLQALQQNGLEEAKLEECQALRMRIDKGLR